MAQAAGIDLTGMSYSERLAVMRWAVEGGKCPDMGIS